jgi:hypothetical protein
MDDREAGLPRLVSDEGAPTNLMYMAKGVVRAVYPDEWRVDIETDHGGMLHKAVVLSPYLPPVHQDLVQPSHVYFVHAYGHAADAICWPLTFRRLLDPERELTKEEGKNDHSQRDRGDTSDSEGEGDEPSRHFYNLHVYCQRAGDITIRITDDNKWVVESEAGDTIRYDQKKREVDVLAPTVRIGSMEHTRVEYVRADHVHVVMPDIRLGTPTSEQQVILGNLWQQFYNAFVDLFNQHRHRNVQPGGGLSGPPFQFTNHMEDDLLSDITRTQKSFPEEDF